MFSGLRKDGQKLWRFRRRSRMSGVNSRRRRIYPTPCPPTRRRSPRGARKLRGPKESWGDANPVWDQGLRDPVNHPVFTLPTITPPHTTTRGHPSLAGWGGFESDRGETKQWFCLPGNHRNPTSSGQLIAAGDLLTAEYLSCPIHRKIPVDAE